MLYSFLTTFAFPKSIFMYNVEVAEFKKVFLLFSPKLDTNFMTLDQIAHKLWILSLFFLFTTFGDERVAKN